MATPKFIRRIKARPEGNAKYRITHDGYNSTLFEITPEGHVRIIDGPDIAARPDEAEQAELIELYPQLKSEVKPLWTTQPWNPVDENGRPVHIPESEVHFYRNERGECGLAVHRIVPTEENKLKEKKCIPWIPTEGGRWIQQEYPGLRPLYGEYWSKKRIMIHEGEKSVDTAVRAMADADHPWRDWLGKFAHVSWRGGAIYGAPRKADWSLIPQGSQIFLLPDNDEPGFNSMRQVAEHLGNAESVVMAEYQGTPLSINGHTAPGLKGWDIADGVPEGLEDPTILENSALLAEPIQESRAVVNAKGDLVIEWVPRDEFCRKIVHCMNLGVYYVREPTRIRGPFDSRQKLIETYQHLAYRPDRLSLLWSNVHIRRVDIPGYRPEVRLNSIGEPVDPQAFHALPHGRIFNTYQAPRRQVVRPGGIRDFLTASRPVWDLLKHLIPDPIQRKTFIRWASLVVIGEKPKWATLLVSETHGTGKSTLLNLLGAIVGRDNFSSVKSDTLEEKYNSWIKAQLVLCHELKEGARGSWTLAERLKSVITEELISMREMNTDPYTGENVCNVFAASNHVDCMRITDEDRRWYIPTVAEVKLEPRIAARIATLPNDRRSFGILLWSIYNYGMKMKANSWLINNAEAPRFGNKSTLIENTRGPIQDIIVEEYVSTSENQPLVLLIKDIQALMEERREKKSPQMITRSLKTMGFSEVSGLSSVLKMPKHLGAKAATERLTLYSRGDTPPQEAGETMISYVLRICNLRSGTWNQYRDRHEDQHKQEAANDVL